MSILKSGLYEKLEDNPSKVSFAMEGTEHLLHK